MSGSDDQSGPDADRTVKRGETYDHSEHGRVEVSGIWKGVKEVDSAHNTEQKDVIIVRYSAERDGESIDELTDTLDEFLEATKTK